MPIALYALTLIGALVAAVFFAGTEEQRMAEYSRFAHQALGAAEVELAGALDNLGGPRARTLSESLYLLDVTATDKPARGRRRLGLLARVRPPALALRAALTTRGPVTLHDGARIDGADHAPAGWESCAPADTGLPAIHSSAAPLDAVDYEDLGSRATTLLPGGSYAPQPAFRWDGSCDSSVATNWGDDVASRGGCAGYAPAVRVVGDLELTSGRGQGVLLVDGDLTLSGPFEYVGLIIVGGRIATSLSAGDVVKLWGAVVVGNPSDGPQTLTGDLSVQYSNCVLDKALRSVARPQPLRSRGWIQLF